MNVFSWVRIVRFVCVAVALTALQSVCLAGPPVLSVRGHGDWEQDTGVVEDGQYIEQTSINAWKDADGRVTGTVAWESIYQAVPAEGWAGPGWSGYPWQLEVLNIELVAPNEVWVWAVVVHSPQMPADEGLLWSFRVEDNGPPNSDTPDRLDGSSLIRGDFTIDY